MRPRHIHQQATAAVCRALGHITSRVHGDAWECPTGQEVATAAFAPFIDPATRADLAEDIAAWLYDLDNAWDAPSDKTTPAWAAERAATVLTVLLSRLGHGTPTMRGEYCDSELPDGSTCIYGRHHTARTHHSMTGATVATTGPVSVG